MKDLPPTATETKYTSTTVKAVMAAQERLNKNGHNLSKDGWFGQITCKAWYNYYGKQKGTIKPTVNIDKLNCPTIKLQQGNKGELVKILQTALQELGYYQGYKLDGDYGPKTKTAVQQFQRATKHTPDGWVGPKTCPDLKRLYKAKYQIDKQELRKIVRPVIKVKAKTKKKKKGKTAAQIKKERNKKINKIIHIYKEKPNILIDGIKFIATDISSSTNQKGINWQTVELMGDKLYTYKGHRQPLEYDVTVPMHRKIYTKVKKYLYELCNAPMEVVSTDTTFTSGKYYITFTISSAKGLWLNIKFHMVGL